MDFPGKSFLDLFSFPTGSAAVGAIVVSLTAAWGFGEACGFARSLEESPQGAEGETTADADRARAMPLLPHRGAACGGARLAQPGR
eukprot:gene9370-biopygen1672